MPFIRVSDLKNKYFYSAESVGAGHPDKLADQIADLVLDYLRDDYGSHVQVACEVICGFSNISVLGEVNLLKSKIDTSSELLKIEQKAKDKILIFLQECIYFQNNQIIKPDMICVKLNLQSNEIYHTLVSPTANGNDSSKKKLGASDQGYSYGYAISFGIDYFTTHAYLAHLFLRMIRAEQEKQDSYFKKNTFSDMKSQVIGYYVQKNNEVLFCIDKLILSIQNKKSVDINQFREQVKNDVILKGLNSKEVKSKIIFNSDILDDKHCFINSSGSFHIGGLFADTGTTGRKIIVDSYGGGVPIGGGAFSGKDPSKLDRSGAYYARYIAKNLLVALNLKECLVSIHYVMGSSKFAAISIEVDDDQEYNKYDLVKIVEDNFSLDVFHVIELTNSSKLRFRDLSVFGHFARQDLSLTWEKLDKVKSIREYLKILKK